MLFDGGMCTGCLTCRMVCSLFCECESNPSVARIVIEEESGRPTARFTPDCDECGLCAEYCPYGALGVEG